MKKTFFTAVGLALCIACAIWLRSMRFELVPSFDARQVAMEYGDTVIGTARYVKHEGFTNMGVRYAVLEYEVEGKGYQSEVRFAQNFRKLPGEEDAAGRHPVVIHYDVKDPENAAIECAQKGWKLAKISLLAMEILLWLNAAIVAIGLVVIVKDELVPHIVNRYS